MATQITRLFVPQNGETPAHYENYTHDPNLVITDRVVANERAEEWRKQQERIAHNDALIDAYREQCAVWEQRLEAFLNSQPDCNPIQARVRADAWIRLNPMPKPPKLT